MKTMAKLYVCNSLQDDELKIAIQELFFQPVDEIYVLPNYVERTKNLLSGLTTKVGSFVDYPLFSGTIAKIAYETVDLFKRGADKLLVGFLSTQLTAENWKRLKELCNTLKPLYFENKKLIYFINAQRTKEIEFVETAKRLQELHVKQVALAADNMQKGIDYAKIFRKEFGQTMDLAVYVKNNEFMDLQPLLEMGIDQVGTIFVN
jgi:deoxyribose-phosphate aldolase